MTEAEWLTCAEPKLMLEYLRGPAVREVREMFGRLIPFEVYPERRGSDRKLRLLAVACCRRHWYLLDEAHCRKLVEVGEHFEGKFNPTGLPLDACQRALELVEVAADSPVDPKALTAASEAADLFHFPASDYAACYGDEWGPFDTELMASGNAAYAVYYACNQSIDFSSVSGVSWQMAYAASYLKEPRDGTERGADPVEYAAQAGLIREVFGNPFRPVAIDPNWLTSTVVALAEGIYADRAFDRMPILADALQDAGCANDDILHHCRDNSQVHVRGCWVIDLLTGRG